MQVELLKKSFGAEYEIGTIDKFQGKEAQVVIISMASSLPEESARGIDFLFDVNRLNVAVSRAKALALIVASRELARTRASNPEQVKKVAAFFKLIGKSNQRYEHQKAKKDTYKIEQLKYDTLFESACGRCFTGAEAKAKGLVAKVLGYIDGHNIFKNLDIDVVGSWQSPGKKPTGHAHLSKSIQTELPGFNFGSQYNNDGTQSADLKLRNPVFRLYFSNNKKYKQQLVISFPWSINQEKAFKNHIEDKKLLERFEKHQYEHHRKSGGITTRHDWVLMLSESTLMDFFKVMNTIARYIDQFSTVNRRLNHRDFENVIGLRFEKGSDS
jgi:hypothetical protein